MVHCHRCFAAVVCLHLFPGIWAAECKTEDCAADSRAESLLRHTHEKSVLKGDKADETYVSEAEVKQAKVRRLGGWLVRWLGG